jgi:cell division initiation protein
VKITPLDIRRKEFKRSVRGYSDEEVDIFLDEVADEFERLFQENMELHDRMARMDEQIAGHAQLKDALEKTLISAQLQAEELRANAHKESELILRDAELKARGIVSDSYGETQKTQHTLVQLKLLEEDFRFKFRSLLEGYVRLLDQAPRASAGSESAPPPQTPAVAPEAKAAPAVVAPVAAPVTAPITAPTPVAATVAPATPVAQPAAATPVPVARPIVPAPFGETTASPPARSQASAAPAVPAMPPTQPATPPVAPSAPSMAAPSTQAAPVVPAMPAAPAQPQSPPTPPTPPYRSALAFTPVDQPSMAAAPAERPSEPAKPVPPPLDDDQPTHESRLGPNDAQVDQIRWPQAPPEGDVTQEVETAESALTQEAAMSDRTEDEPLRRFFFGRQLNDVDDTFQPEDAGKKEWNREFEW